MSLASIISIVVTAAACVVLIILMYRTSKKNAKKRDEQQASIDNYKQTVNILIIDKKKLRLKHSGLPQQVLDDAPWYSKFSKIPIVKAKIGPKIVILVADNDIFDVIPVKKEVKATIAGIYISDVRGIRGPLDKPDPKKRSFVSKLFGER